MINLAELRPGNLLSAKGLLYTVAAVSFTGLEALAFMHKGTPEGAPDNYDYVALTADWMMRLAGNDKGYVVISETDRESPSSDIHILSTVECYLDANGLLRVNAYEYERYPDGSAEVPDDVILLGYEHIRYVHQLQNLYFVLTGKELPLNG